MIKILVFYCINAWTHSHFSTYNSALSRHNYEELWRFGPRFYWRWFVFVSLCHEHAGMERVSLLTPKRSEWMLWLYGSLQGGEDDKQAESSAGMQTDRFRSEEKLTNCSSCLTNKTNRKLTTGSSLCMNRDTIGQIDRCEMVYWSSIILLKCFFFKAFGSIKLKFSLYSSVSSAVSRNKLQVNSL